jgi:hypothetical protein
MNAASYQGCKDAGAALMERIGTPNAQIAVLGIPFALQTIRDREKGILDAVGEAGGQIVSLQSDFNQDKLLALASNAIAANPIWGHLRDLVPGRERRHRGRQEVRQGDPLRRLRLRAHRLQAAGGRQSEPGSPVRPAGLPAGQGGDRRALPGPSSATGWRRRSSLRTCS